MLGETESALLAYLRQTPSDREQRANPAIRSLPPGPQVWLGLVTGPNGY